MDTVSYSPPVDKLLTYGDCQKLNVPGWPDYLELGLGPEHIPELIRMATDKELHQAYSDTLEVWAPVHAWRALGQLHAEAAIEPLISLFITAEDDEWAMEELPKVFGVIGPAAIPAVSAFIADASHGEWPRIHASACLEKIGTMHPDSRAECVAVLSHQLELFDENGPDLNAFLVHALVELKAEEAAPVIKRAFDAGSVEQDVMGDWDEVQVELGLKTREEVPQRRFNPLLPVKVQSGIDKEVASSSLSPSKTVQKGSATHKKAKQRMAKESRKKNRNRR